MGSFSKMNVWPVGYFRSYSSWLLRNRKDIASRINVLNAEIGRIGSIRVSYRAVVENGAMKVTEERLGFSVTSGSSLGRLCQAYVANGGNPLDISSFMYPDCTEVLEQDADGSLKVIQQYPHGGILAPMSAEPNEPLPQPGKTTGYGSYPGGYLRTDNYYPARQGGRKSKGNFDFNALVKTMHQIRGWANQDIKERLQDIEWRIIKLADLREQLIKERDDILVQAFGGVLTGVGEFDNNRFDTNMRVQNLVQDMYELLYDMAEDGSVRSFSANSKVAYLGFTFEDTSSENRDPLG